MFLSFAIRKTLLIPHSYSEAVFSKMVLDLLRYWNLRLIPSCTPPLKKGYDPRICRVKNVLVGFKWKSILISENLRNEKGSSFQNFSSLKSSIFNLVFK
jgi:hypothetical protein